MRDLLMLAQQHPLLRNLVKAAGLPAPTPLRRGSGASEPQPLGGLRVILGGGGFAHDALRTALTDAGARVETDPPPSPGETVDALMLDASGLAGPADLDSLYAFFHPRLGALARNGRVLVVTGTPDGTAEVARATARRAVEGFVRSVAKEVGKRGATANVLYVEEGAEARLAWPVRFLLSARSAYVDGQPLTVSGHAASPDAIPLSATLAGKVALVTGAARGIGAATARRLGAEGAHVVCLDVPGDLGSLNATAEAAGGAALPLDLRAAETPARVAAFLRERWRGVDVVVHNAGITRDKTLARMDADQWRMVLDINLSAILAVDDALLTGDVLRPGGRVVCLSSIGGLAGNVGQSNYGTTKAGLVGYVRAMAPRHAGRGITFNAVAPGFIETRMTEAMPVLVREVGRRLNSLSQGGLPDDVAEAIAFLCAPGAHGISGQVLRVCGQSLMGA